MGRFDGEKPRTPEIPDEIGTAVLAEMPLALVLTNPHLDDNPIVYANRAFEKITRYSAEAAIGRNCRFLQGDGTDPAQVRQLAEAVRDERDFSVDIVNYRSDGTRFLNRLMITPLYDDEQNLQCFLGIQRDMSEGTDLDLSGQDKETARIDAALGEVQHRVKNHLAMVVGMIRMQARSETSREAFDALARRIESLQLLYQEMTEAGIASTRDRRVPLGAYVSRIAATIGHLDGRRSIRVNIDCDAIEDDVERAARIGLLFSELLTNALKHAFEGREVGLVEARLKMLSSGVIRMTVGDDGIGLPPGSAWPHRSSDRPVDVEPETAGRDAGEGVDAPNAAQEPHVARQIAESLDHDSDAAGSDVVDTSGKALARQRRSQAQGGLGGRITLSLVQGLDARLDVSSGMSGTVVTVDIPPEDAP
ncbi:PAS domain-containing protein [Aurantimonas sp. A2-1-M11]|uniref:PAS domain-containing protein n=1 Tax=Aurantimonas sp. A2-1-M11 TaxID=3113712 RepID=UPI002F955052